MTLHLILQRRNGFNNRICLNRDSQVKAFIVGLFGRGPRLNGFDKTLFLASGVGIAAHLLTIRHLLYAHEADLLRSSANVETSHKA